MKKCFDNIKYLELFKMKDKYDATHMYSSDGERVEFRIPVHLDGAVEVHVVQHMCMLFSCYLCV